jgi:aryl-alcohol dehydrogenase-like predicted oxidoreductase
MQTTTLGPFTVSRLCLGTMLMGGVIDLYQVHAPDPDVPIEETLAMWLLSEYGVA